MQFYRGAEREECRDALPILRVLRGTLQASAFLFFPWSLRKKLRGDGTQSEFTGILFPLICFIPLKKDLNRRVSIHVQSRKSGAKQEQRLAPIPPPALFTANPTSVSHLCKSDRRICGQTFKNEK